MAHHLIRLGPSLAGQKRVFDLQSGEEEVLNSFAKYALSSFARSLVAAGRLRNDDGRAENGAQALADLVTAILVEGAGNRPIATWEAGVRTVAETIRMHPQVARRWLASGAPEDFLDLRTQARDALLQYLGRQPLPSGELYAIQGHTQAASPPADQSVHSAAPPPAPSIPSIPRRSPAPTEVPIPEREPVEREPVVPEVSPVPTAIPAEVEEELPLEAEAPSMLRSFLDTWFGEPAVAARPEGRPEKVEAGPRAGPRPPPAKSPAPGPDVGPPIVPSKTIEPIVPRPEPLRPQPVPPAAAAAVATSPVIATAGAVQELSQAGAASATVAKAASALARKDLDRMDVTQIDMFSREVADVARAARAAAIAARDAQARTVALSRDLSNTKARAAVHGADRAAERAEAVSTALTVAAGAATKAAQINVRSRGRDRVDVSKAISEAQDALRRAAVEASDGSEFAARGTRSAAEEEIIAEKTQRTAPSVAPTALRDLAPYVQSPQPAQEPLWSDWARAKMLEYAPYALGAAAVGAPIAAAGAAAYAFRRQRAGRYADIVGAPRAAGAAAAIDPAQFDWMAAANYGQPPIAEARPAYVPTGETPKGPKVAELSRFFDDWVREQSEA